ncbi:lipase secretion chaperone [Marinobacter sp.]|uniref:lipase secretion chaperone n=1 Tax=Marinobacter sp. TaxID=50741 RepID=UPI003563B1F2
MSTKIRKPRQPAPSRKNSRAAIVGAGAGMLGVVAVVIWAGGKALIPDPAEAPLPDAELSYQPSPPEPDRTPAEPEDRIFSESALNMEEPDQPAGKVTDADDEPDLNIPFQIEQVAHALSRVEVDDDGNVVINEAAQTVLEQAFMDARVTMDEQQLEELKAMIQAGLEGPAGAQAVEVAEKFYRYSNAFREISDTLATRSDPDSLRGDYEQIQRLRRTHLGPELAEELYGREEQLTRYTLEVMEIQADPNLTPEQRQEKQREVASRYPEVMPGGDNDADSAREQATN